MVALTANIMVSELEKYKNYGFSGYLGKPFTSQELWKILLEYLKPVNSDLIDEEEYNRKKEKLLSKLRLNFVRSNQNTFSEITSAISAGDITLAKRLVHTLKGNAGHINETKLQELAETIEGIFKTGEIRIPETDIKSLESELILVLEKLKPMYDEAELQNEKQAINDEQVRVLFDELEPLLKRGDAKSVRHLSAVRAVPGTEELALQIERIELRAAYKTLIQLREQMEV